MGYIYNMPWSMAKLFRFKCLPRRETSIGMTCTLFPLKHFKMFSISSEPEQYSCVWLGGRVDGCHFVVECFDDINVSSFFLCSSSSSWRKCNRLKYMERNDNNVFDLGKMENKGFIELKVILRFLAK